MTLCHWVNCIVIIMMTISEPHPRTLHDNKIIESHISAVDPDSAELFSDWSVRLFSTPPWPEHEVIWVYKQVTEDTRYNILDGIMGSWHSWRSKESMIASIHPLLRLARFLLHTYSVWCGNTSCRVQNTGLTSIVIASHRIFTAVTRTFLTFPVVALHRRVLKQVIRD